MGDPDAVPIFLIRRQTSSIEKSLEAVHVFVVAHIAFGIFLRRLGDISPLGKICLLVSHWSAISGISYHQAADGRYGPKLLAE